MSNSRIVLHCRQEDDICACTGQAYSVIYSLTHSVCRIMGEYNEYNQMCWFYRQAITHAFSRYQGNKHAANRSLSFKWQKQTEMLEENLRPPVSLIYMYSIQVLQNTYEKNKLTHLTTNLANIVSTFISICKRTYMYMCVHVCLGTSLCQDNTPFSTSKCLPNLYSSNYAWSITSLDREKHRTGAINFIK